MPAINGPVQHVVVLLLENRSYDNVLGWLYNAGNAPPYDQVPAGQPAPNGLTGSEANVNPYTSEPYMVAEAAPNTVGGSGQLYPATTMPVIDPNETFENMAQQYLGVPKSTALPYERYPPTPPPPLMSGFMANYQLASRMSEHNIGDVMTYFTPAQLPVTSFLANRFGVCDTWFAPVPSHTFVNRLFAFCAAPQIVHRGSWYSVVDDIDFPFHPFELRPDSDVVQTDSICSRLDAAGFSWKVYFHDYCIAAMTIPYISGAARSSETQNKVSTFDGSDWGGKKPTQLAGPAVRTFVEDVQNGTLPAFSFIEPRYAYDQPGIANHLPPNSNHPGPINYGLFPHVEPTDPPIDATGGELLLMTLYNLLRGSETYWQNTLLVITYDEPGGVYDHVPPQKATPPGTVSVDGKQQPVPPAKSLSGDKAADGFGYTVTGGRVPAIVVSPYIAAGLTARDAGGAAFDHTSIVKTVFDLFGGLTPLTERDAGAPSLVQFLQPSAVNAAPPFSGTIVASPSAVILHGGRFFDVPSTTLLASAGPGFTLSAAASSLTTWGDNGRNWLTLEPSTVAVAPGITAWTVSIDRDAVGDFGSAYLTGELAVSAGGATTVTVPVSLYLD